MREAFTRAAEAHAGRELLPSEVSAFWAREALAFIAAEPGRWLALELRKLALFFNAREVWNIRAIEVERDFSAVLRLPLLRYGAVAPLGLLGIALSARRWRALFPLHAMLGVYLAAALVFFVLARYRIGGRSAADRVRGLCARVARGTRCARAAPARARDRGVALARADRARASPDRGGQPAHRLLQPRQQVSRARALGRRDRELREVDRDPPAASSRATTTSRIAYESAGARRRRSRPGSACWPGRSRTASRRARTARAARTWRGGLARRSRVQRFAACPLPGVEVEPVLAQVGEHARDLGRVVGEDLQTRAVVRLREVLRSRGTPPPTPACRARGAP